MIVKVKSITDIEVPPICDGVYEDSQSNVFGLAIITLCIGTFCMYVVFVIALYAVRKSNGHNNSPALITNRVNKALIYKFLDRKLHQIQDVTLLSLSRI